MGWVHPWCRGPDGKWTAIRGRNDQTARQQQGQGQGQRQEQQQQQQRQERGERQQGRQTENKETDADACESEPCVSCLAPRARAHSWPDLNVRSQRTDEIMASSETMGVTRHGVGVTSGGGEV